MRGRSYSYSPSPPRSRSRRYRSPSPRGRYGGRPRDLPTSLLVRNLRLDCREVSRLNETFIQSLEKEKTSSKEARKPASKTEK